MGFTLICVQTATKLLYCVLMDKKLHNNGEDMNRVQSDLSEGRSCILSFSGAANSLAQTRRHLWASIKLFTGQCEEA